jgi:hypothetical protein
MARLQTWTLIGSRCYLVSIPSSMLLNDVCMAQMRSRCRGGAAMATDHTCCRPEVLVCRVVHVTQHY